MGLNLSDISKIAIIVECESNQTPNIIKSKSQIKGHGLRYRVRIAGVHDDKTPIKDLPFAYPIFPVTAGSGHGGSYQSCNLKVGSRVLVVYQKEDDTNPLILGVIPNDINTQISSNDPWNYTLGYSTNSQIPIHNISVDKNLGNLNGTFCQATYATLFNESDLQQNEDAKNKSNVPKPNPCEDSIPLGQIQNELRDTIQKIQKARKNIKSWSSVISKLSSDITDFIKKKAQKLTDIISGFFKGIEKGITEKIKNSIEDIYYVLFPSERQKTKRAIETALDLIGCLFKKIGKRLFGVLTSILDNIVDKLINVPTCFVENFTTSLIGKMLGLITNSLNSILSPLESIIGSAINVVDNILNIVEDLLTFISCEEKQYCPEINSWSIWDGESSNETSSIDFSKVEKTIQGAIDSVGNLSIDDITNNVDLDFSDIFNNNCNTGPIVCGPPTLNILGGGGSGTRGNVIVSSIGEILGVDITYPGSGYSSTPKISFNDSCGIGNGAVGTAVLGPIPILPPELIVNVNKIDLNKYNINWKTTNAVRVETNFGSSEINGSVDVTPNETTTYSIRAYNKNGAVTTKNIKIDIETNQINYGPELLFSSTYIKENIYRLAWSTENAIRVTSNFNIAENQFNGFKEVSPSVSTEYTIKSYGTNGTFITKTIILSPRNIEPQKPKSDLPIDSKCQNEIEIKNLKIIQDFPADEIGIVKIIINQSGSNYLSTPDGRLGGDGRVWAESNETYVIRSNGNYDIPYPPNSIINLNPCDVVVPPCEPKFVVKEKGTYIAPNCNRITLSSTVKVGNDLIYPVLETGKYPVILYLCDAIIDNPGLNYSLEDVVDISPNNGARAVAEFSESGRLVKIKIVSGGQGFLTRPNITIISNTGFNAKITPVLCIDKVNINNQLNLNYDSNKVLHVIDCPGKIYA